MNTEYLEILAIQVMFFRNELLRNGANEETANVLTNTYIATCLTIAASGKER